MSYTDKEYVSNCCGCPMDKDESRCPDCKEGCGVETIAENE